MGDLHARILFAVVLAGCASAPPAPATPGASASSHSASAHGINVAGMDRTVLPGDDFYAYASGNWTKGAVIPPDRSAVEAGTALVEAVDNSTRDLLETAERERASSPSAQRLGDYYATFMDEAAIEARALAPLQPQLARIQAIATRADLAAVLGDNLRADVDPLNAGDLRTEHLFGLWVAPDLQDPSHYAPYLLQGGLGLPDRDYYLSDAPEMATIRAQYQAHLVTVLKLAGGQGDLEARANRVVALEREIAQAHVSRVDSEDVHKANNPWTPADFATRAPGLDWGAFFKAAKLNGQGHFIVWQPTAFTGLAALVGRAPLDTWKEYLAVHALERAAPYLPAAFVNERFAFHEKTLRGTPKPRERWKRGVEETNEALGDAVGQVYVKKFFPPEAKAKVEAIVANLVTAFGKRIDALAWMSPATRAKAREKLTTLYVGIGYPEHWRDDAALQVVRGDALGNSERAERFAYADRLRKLGQPIDRTEWPSMEPQVVNAVNMPLQNALAFPAAILRPPFFDPAASDAVNYGAIGAVIGHEISHSFDDQGSQFDAVGRATNWWTPDDLAHFEAAAATLVAQYGAYHPLPGLAINGKLTLSENIADVAGLSAAYDAFRASTTASPGAPATQADGFTTDQELFLSFAQTWREKMREPELRERLLTDGHSPAPFRALTVRNLDAWYAAFDVKPGQALFLAPADRVRVW